MLKERRWFLFRRARSHSRTIYTDLYMALVTTDEHRGSEKGACQRTAIHLLRSIRSTVCDNWTSCTKKTLSRTCTPCSQSWQANLHCNLSRVDRVEQRWHWLVIQNEEEADRFARADDSDQYEPNLYILDLKALGFRSRVAAIAFFLSSSCRVSL